MELITGKTYEHRGGKRYTVCGELGGGVNYAYGPDGERNRSRVFVVGERDGKAFGPIRSVNVADLKEVR